MITGAYIENVTPTLITAGTNNSLSPFQIITQSNYFIVERILATTNFQSNDTSSTIYIEFISSNRQLSNTPFPISFLLGSGLKNKNNKALLIIPPNENINITVYNNEIADYIFGIEFFGYYVNDNGIKIVDGQAIDPSIINKLF